MKIAALADVKAHLSAFVDECVNKGPVIITRNGKAAAVSQTPLTNPKTQIGFVNPSNRFASPYIRSDNELNFFHISVRHRLHFTENLIDQLLIRTARLFNENRLCHSGHCRSIKQSFYR